GMLMSAAYTLYGLRKRFYDGIRKSSDDVEKTSSNNKIKKRTEKDISILIIISGIFLLSAAIFFIYWWFMGFKNDNLLPALTIALVLMVIGFFFTALSGYLVGVIGSSNNPVSGMTITSIVLTAFILLMIGINGEQGVVLVLAGAGIICVGAAVAGAALQEMKVGHILGGTPWKMQTGNFAGVIVSALVMWIPLFILNAGDLKMAELNGYRGGFGGDVLAAPQAGLMAQLSKGIVGGEMVWPLIIVGIVMAFGFILVKVQSPMLVCVGMYLSFETVAAIFAGGIIRWVIDMIIERGKYSTKEISCIDNRGVLLASGLIAGEAFMGLLFAALAFSDVMVPNLWEGSPFTLSIVVIIALGYLLVRIPLTAVKE
ncbi:MAG: OPT/YSL family transporter, partial [Candidatus Aminicenantes bacterium]|nr:OPT/YSL family transporter [Candidatus Aminicenantes bacterium]